MKAHIVVVGGGFAGAAAASAIAETGHSVTLIEQRATLGGRARSLRDGVTKEEVDNGQHLFMGCYRDTREFLRRLRVEDRVVFLPSLRVPFLEPGGRRSTLVCPPWPAGLGFLAGVQLFKAMRMLDRWSLVRGLLGFRLNGRRDLAGLTVTQWLDAMRQPAGARRAFWTPLCLATLNERPEVACAAALAAVLREGLLGGPSSSALGYSRVSLNKLWPVELSAYLKRQGGVVAAEQTVAGFVTEGRRVRAVRMEGGETVDADAVVCAVPLPAFLTIRPEPLRALARGLEDVTYSAIASVNFWLPEPAFDDLFVGLLDTETQWVFNRHRLWEGLGASPGYVSAVISGAAKFASYSSDRMAAMAWEDLRRCLPTLGERPPHATVVWEKQATPSPSPANWAKRPPVETALENFFLAGDWVDVGLPATIEAACRSGHRAARAALARVDAVAVPAVA